MVGKWQVQCQFRCIWCQSMEETTQICLIFKIFSFTFLLHHFLAATWNFTIFYTVYFKQAVPFWQFGYSVYIDILRLMVVSHKAKKAQNESAWKRTHTRPLQWFIAQEMTVATSSYIIRVKSCPSVCLSICIPFDVTHLLSNRCEFQSVFSAKRSAHHLGTQWRLNRVCNCRH